MNVLTVTGRLTSDPARRDTTKGVVCEFRLAVDGQRRLWLPVVCWGHLAGICKQYLYKGRRVAVDGQLQVDEFLGAAGDLRRRWYLRADHVTLRRRIPTPRPARQRPVDNADSGDSRRGERRSAADWVFRHAGGCLIEVPPLQLPSPPPDCYLTSWVATCVA